ncbi:HlyD family type I secretion periplasmic adaptor subunit [Paracraurococcus lichenis]|uniref:Membrane fusion protein (MFP) family protein n=1 Tax=Paracraurococcus lichenis TaxID=3064888 RepID=A0ABT9EAK7_9PROT|nr:HlyD family type I secretion periplasmic adaptor subunit [Paracraurococcus sp. LOR1-02]MDO9713018.1 HlyD family type I secretion periplasmic adaptor subunit [Paracraurococcus sp. LOR1-02]
MSKIITLPRASLRPSPDRHVLALEEVRLQGVERAFILGTAMLIVLLLVWARAAHLPEIAVAPGEVATAVAAAPVQHLEGGIIEAVLIVEGEEVSEGQPLLRLHDAAARADLGQMQVRNAALRLQADRLSALVAGGDLPEGGGLVVAQRAALQARLAAQEAQRVTLQEQVAQRRSEIVTLRGQAQATERQVAMFREELATRQTLARDGLSTRTAVLDATRLLLGAEAERERINGQLVTAGRALAESEARLDELRSTRVDEARQEIARITQEIAETEEMIGRLADRVERTLVRAPSAGVVRGLSVTRPGSVIQPGALIAEILPRDARLVAEVRVAPRDIGFVTPGEAVNVKVQAFDFSRYGTIEGKVERISVGSFQDEQHQPYWRARITLAQAHVGRNPELARLAPGMIVSAEITTGHKTVLQYLLKPLYASVATAFRER